MAPFVDGPAGARRDRDRHRPAAPQGRGRAAGVPPRRPVGARRRGRRPLVRWAGREPRRGRAGRAVRRASSCSATRSIRPARPSGPRRGSPTGRRSAARSCCCRASPTRSPGSSCCGRRVGLLAARGARHLSAARAHAQAGPRRTSSTARRRSCEASRAPDRGPRTGGRSVDKSLATGGRGSYPDRPPRRRATSCRRRPSPSRRIGRARGRGPNGRARPSRCDPADARRAPSASSR